MPDKHTPEQRSFNMSRIRSSGTAPERRLGSLLQLMFPDAIIEEHPSVIPGKPDFYIPKMNIAFFADGCFFHRCPRHYITPLNNCGYWSVKIIRNHKRDLEINRELKKIGVYPVRIWEHNLGHDLTSARRKIRRAYRQSQLLYPSVYK
jgi:DNA mismatch endonuclease (patch repair protein)